MADNGSSPTGLCSASVVQFLSVGQLFTAKTSVDELWTMVVLLKLLTLHHNDETR